MAVSMRHTNPDWTEAFMTRLKGCTDQEIAVGYPRGESGSGNAHYENGASILEVAVWNNDGAADGVPERAFMELAAKLIKPEARKMLLEAMPKVLAGEMSMDQLQTRLGLMGEDKIREAINEGAWAPNSPVTIRRKKSSKPLIDKGDMRQLATHAKRKRTK